MRNLPARIFSDVVPGLAGFLRGGHEILVGVADAEVGDLLVVEQHDIFAFDTLDHHVRRNVLLLLGAEHASRLRLQRRDEIGDLLHLLDAQAHRARNLRVTLAAEVVEMLVDHDGFDGFGLAEAVELNEQAFLQIARADPHGMKRLHQIECLL